MSAEGASAVLWPWGEAAEGNGEVTAGDTGREEAGVEELVPFGGPEFGELEDFEEVEVVERKVH